MMACRFDQPLYEGFQAAVAAGVPKEKAGILVDDQFGAAILRDAVAQGCDAAVWSPPGYWT